MMKQSNLLTRTIAGIVLFGLLFLCCYYGRLTFLIVFGAVFFMTIREMEEMLLHLGKRICMVPAYVFASLFGPLYYMTGENLLYVGAFGMLMIVFAVSCAVDRAAEHVIFVKKRFERVRAEIYRRNFNVRFQKFVYVFLHCLGGFFLAEQIVIKFEIGNRRD